MDQSGKILQWNARSIVNKKSDLIYLINKFDPYVIALSETWLKAEISFKFQGYISFREDRSDGKGGVALLIKQSFHPIIHPITSHNNNYSIIAAIANNICYVSVYIPYPSSAIFNELEQLFSSLPQPFIFLGDFNAHHCSWGSPTTDSYGEQILDILERQNLCLLNTGQPTRRSAPHENDSAVDLTICTPNLASSLIWKVLPYTYGSDHFPIIISLPIKNKPVPQRKPRLKYRLADADWLKFKTEIDIKISALHGVCHGHENNCAKDLAKVIVDTADQLFPQKNGSLGKIPSPPWWDSECTEAVRKRKEAEKIYKQQMTEENYDSLLEIMSDVKKFLRKKKLESWKRFCASICPDTPASIVWQQIRRFKSAFTDTSYRSLPESLANKFLDRLAPPYVHEQSLTIPIVMNPDVIDNLSSPFTLYELKGILSNTKDTAPGLDGIPYSFMAHFSDNSLSYYLDLVNTVMMTGNVPIAWRTQTVLPLLKPNKPPFNADSYRPIALSTVLGKIAEHLIKNRLEWFLESRGLLSNSQFGFRKGKSTLDCLGILITDIRLAFSNNKSLGAVFVDIRAAYDNVIIQILQQKLLKLNVPSILCRFIINFISERYIHFETEDSSLIRTVWKGLPQGSVLSPLLYNIYTQDLESKFDVNSVSILQYADDVVLYSSDKSVNTISYNLTNALSSLNGWLHNNGLELSISKTTLVLFSRMRMPPPVIILCNDRPIEVKSQVKYLGMILDCKLTWVQHCEYLIAKCERRMNMMRCLSGVWWGAHPSSMRLLYHAVIRSVFDYGTFFLEPGSVVAFSKLETIQSRALRVIAGAMRSSPIHALQAECGIPPLNLRRQYLAHRYMFKIFQYTDHTLLSKLRILDNLILSSSYWKHKSVPLIHNSFKKILSFTTPVHRSRLLPLYSISFSSLILPTNVVIDAGIHKDDPSPNISFIHQNEQNWPDFHQIFTDASKHAQMGNVGVGVYHKQFGIVQKIKLPPEASVFTGECFGLYKAVEYVLLAKLTKTAIFTDSKSALQTLNKFPFKLKSQYDTIFKIKELLHKCQECNYDVRFIWVPSHCGIRGNEIADRLANEAVFDGDVHPYKNFIHDLANLPKRFIYDSWTKLYLSKSEHKGKYYYQIQPEIPTKPWFTRMNFGKTVTSIIIRMRLGHTCTPAHLAKLGIINTDKCDCSDSAVGDVNHIFFSCPKYDRSSFLETLTILHVPFPTNIECLISSNSYCILKALELYIKQNTIKI